MDFAHRLEDVTRGINEDCKVRELCLEFPRRLEQLVHKTQGDRLPK